MSPVYRLRIILLYAWIAVSATLWCLAGSLLARFLSPAGRTRMIAWSWCWLTVRASRWLVGINYQVQGLENIPARPCVILANHQSAWETFFLTGSYFSPQTQVLKRELLDIPLFGWAIRLTSPIAIDRQQPRLALKQVVSQGLERLQQGFWVLIFPEGTRLPAGQTGRFSRSGAALAARAGVPILPVAHNAGHFWAQNGTGKQPGTIRVMIGPPLYPQGDEPRAIAELNQRAEAWITGAVQTLENRH